MSKYLSISAGKTAYNHIQNYGLQPSDISSIFGASGAAKWLAISGLDKAIFSEWLPTSSHLETPKQSQTFEQKRIDLFGTSVGAWKLAAAAQKQPEKSLDAFAHAYIDQYYGESTTHADVQRETDLIIEKFLTPTAISEILTNNNYNFHCGAVKCKGLISKESTVPLLAGLSLAVIRNLVNSDLLHSQFDRIVFTDSRSPAPVLSDNKFHNSLINLSANNFSAALTACGSIPYVMKGITNIPDADAGMYRDGGLLDYHPIPNNFWKGEGLILYPHFYSHLTPNWFDKPYKHRRANAKQLDNVILISPSEKFLAKLPFGRLPDRHDFKRFYKRDEERQMIWKECKNLSELLGEEFLKIMNKNQLADAVIEYQ